MRYVLDASVALKWVLPGSDSSKAVARRDDFQWHIHELLVPDVCVVEVPRGLSLTERLGISS